MRGMSMFVTRDIVCSAGHLEKNAVLHKDERGNPVYPTCACAEPTRWSPGT